MSQQEPPPPAHIGIIMDGNGRWARARGRPRMAGHKAGVDNIRPILETCVEIGVPYLSLFAFSTENWSRPDNEVSGLLNLLGSAIRTQLDELNANGVQIRHSGNLDRVSPHLQAEMQRAVHETHRNNRITLNVAFNYGGRAEILAAVRRIIRAGVQPEDLDEERFQGFLDQPDLPDLDLIIRTGGEFRLSNFMLWQATYAEYYSTEIFWPAFGPDELRAALGEYARRERRFGGVCPT